MGSVTNMTSTDLGSKVGKKRNKGSIISLYWYGSKDHHFILLPGHILYRKSGGHKIVCTGVKFKSCFNVVENHTNRFLLL